MEPTHDTEAQQSLTGERLLVIDDAADLRELLASALGELGAEVLTAASGAEGLALALEHRPRLVVLDLVMDGMDGWQTLRLLRLEHDAIPVVIVSSRDQPQDKIRALQEGALDYLVKPIQPRRAARRIAALLVGSEDGASDDGASDDGASVGAP